jgi:hypothetical protein
MQGMKNDATQSGWSHQAWQQTGQGQYVFLQNGQVAASMEIALGTMSRQAKVQIGGARFTIERVGFWKTGIEISDQASKVIGICAAEKWYANAMTLDFRGKTYRQVVRNNPLAEYAILEDNAELLAYGLKTDAGKAILGIHDSLGNADILLHCLLWYQFLPIAMENSGDNFVFQMLLGAQLS